MRFSASNIGWTKDNDEQMYRWLSEKGITGLEIAPTRIFPNNPYDLCGEAEKWAKHIKSEYDLSVPSMQSIWYGRTENLFVSDEERHILIEYTKKAIEFAESIECRNLVFGCPRNRNLPEGADASIAEDFFGQLGDYAFEHNTILAMEANPPIYNTNFCNTTAEAIELVKKVGSKGFKVNLDLGTMIENHETVDVLDGNDIYINHVHFSEPGLVLLEKRELHMDIAKYLTEHKYDHFCSLEIKAQDDLAKVQQNLLYMESCFK